MNSSNNNNTFVPMRVGALASATGISIRTLHHYDEIGLLQPSLRSEGGHRLYGNDDIARLQRILSLRALGFALDEIKECIDNNEDFSPRHVLEMHIAILDEKIDAHERLRERLMGVAARLDRIENVSPEEFILIIEAIEMSDKYFNEEQTRVNYTSSICARS